MKFGFICAQFNEIKYIKQCLEPWIKVRENLKVDQLLIAALDVCFLENDANNLNSTDGSLEYLQGLKDNNEIDFFQKLGGGLKEHEARNVALKYLLEQNIDFLITWGSDELIKEEQINYLLNYIKKDNFINWYSINYKNYIFNDKTYTTDFCPPRIWKVKYGDWKLKEFFWDDDIQYSNIEFVSSYKSFPMKKIPNLIVNHLSWNNLERSKNKEKYQRKHFGHCSLKYNEKENKMEFDMDYFSKIRQNPPTLFYED